MRTPRAGARWTQQRQAIRATYVAYMASPAWLTRRGWWMREHRRRTGTAAVCAVCGSRIQIELHHQEYTRLGRETYDDLTAVCARHHRQLHDIYDACKTWRALGRRAASAGIIAAMRRSAISRESLKERSSRSVPGQNRRP